MRLYRMLLRLYPSSYRGEYGDELAKVFAVRHRESPAVVAFVAALADIVPNAAAVHWDILLQDLVYTARTLRRAPGFAITTVLVVALGVGANTAAVSVADFVLLRPLPFPGPEQLVKLWSTTPGYPQMELSPANYRDWKSSAKSFQAMGAYTPTAFNLVAGGEPLRVQAAWVTSDVMDVLRARPLLGRTFTAADTIDGRSAILSHELWSREFGEDPKVLGRAVELDGKPYTIIGVMRSDFHFPSRVAQIWATISFDARDFEDRANNYLDVVARLNPGTTLAQAGAELDVIAARLEREYPQANEKTGATLYRLSDELSERTLVLLLALCGAALCTLILACANLASLLLARAVGREREIAVRTALGAGRERLVRQLVTESVVLAALGGCVGVAVAVVAVPALSLLIPSTLPIADQPSVDLRVLTFASILVVTTVLAFAVVPALRAGGAGSISALREGTRGSGGRRQRVRAMLVMIEVTASVALLATSGLLVRAMWRLQSVDLGFQSANVLTLRTALPLGRYLVTADRDRFYSSVLTRVRALAGVESAAYTTWTPLTMGGGIWPVVIKGQSVIRDAANSASLRMVTPGYFSTLRIPLLKGRDILDTDDNTRPNVAVVSESFAKRYWPDQDPRGKRFTFGLREREVVGVVGDIRVRGPERVAEPQVYVPSKQMTDSMMFFYAPKDLLIRGNAPIAALLPEIRRIVRAADPRQPISNVMTMDDVVAGETASRFAQLRVLGILAIVALLLASIGLHGLLSFTVSRRSQEIGVRVALGAQSQTILRMVLGEGLLLAVGGLIPGIAIAYAAGRGMEAILAGVKPGDPVTFAAAVAICGTASVLGCLRPALRAANVDPATALRAD
jgi:putative ABC transport system permease protein